jgi:CheY-like chemotaxis protein
MRVKVVKITQGTHRVHSVLIVEDDPLHLKLYTWIVESGGHTTIPLLAQGRNVELPSEPFSVALLDYRLGLMQAPELAAQIRARVPNAKLVVLSDSMWLPEDMRPFTDRFVRKGEPEELLKLLATLAT